MVVATPPSNLPDGWTYHELNGRPFFYHAASNTIQQESPAPVVAAPQVSPNDTAMYPEPASEPVPLPQPLPQAAQPQPGVYAPPQQLTAQVTAVVPAAEAQPPQSPTQFFNISEEANADLNHTGFSFMAEAGAPPPPGAPPQAMVHPSPQRMQQPMPLPVAHPPAQQPTPQGQRMAQLQVLVPDPGLRAGQKLAFTAPPSSPGSAPMQMEVTVNTEVVPGSIVTVQYPIPAGSQLGNAGAATVPLAARPLQPTFAPVSPATDHQQMVWAWLLYAAGCVCMCCITPVGMLLWVVAAAMYFCQSAPQRAQMPQTRSPAYAAAFTCAGCLVLGLLLIPVAVALAGFEGSIQTAHFHPGPHHHWHQWHHVSSLPRLEESQADASFAPRFFPPHDDAAGRVPTFFETSKAVGDADMSGRVPTLDEAVEESNKAVGDADMPAGMAVAMKADSRRKQEYNGVRPFLVKKGRIVTV